MRKKLRRFSLHAGRWMWYAGAAVLALLAIVVTAARLMLPQLAERKSEIEAAINGASPREVRLGKLTTYWDGLYPGLRAEGVEVMAADRRTPALRLREVRVSLAWLPLLRRRFEIHSLEVTGPSLMLERLADGRFRIAGFGTMQPTDSAGSIAAEEGQGETFLQWLFRQNRLALLDGDLTWRDQREPGRQLRLTGMNLTLRNNGERHHLGASAVFPPEMCRECSLVVDVTGNPFVSSDWRGDIYLRAGQLNVEPLPQIVRELLPPAMSGRFDVRLWTQWEAGSPRRVEGQLAAAGLTLPLKGLPAPLRVRELRGDIAWKAVGDGGQLDLTKLALGFTRPAWPVDELHVSYGPDTRRLEAGHVDLGDLTAFVETLGGQHALLRRWSELAPAGRLNALKLRLTGDPEAPKGFALEAELDGFGMRPWRRLPGVRGLSGRLSVSPDSGEFVADSRTVALTLGEIFRGPLEAQQLRGRVTWQKRAEGWEIGGDRLRLVAADGQASGEFTLRLPHDAAQSPFLHLEADFKDLNGARASRYYPVKSLSRATLAWMEHAFVGGRVTKGHLLFDGFTREFPFTAGPGRFELRAHVRGGVYRYLAGWAPLTQAEADVAIDNDQVRIMGEGRIGSLSAKDVSVETRRLPDGHEEAQVRGNVTGPVADTLAVLYDVRPDAGGAGWIRYFPAGLKGSGDGALKLAVDVPLDHAPVRVAGEYRFRRAGLREPASGVAIEALDGRVGFGDDGLRESELRGRFLGGDAMLTAVLRDDRLQVQARGQFAPEGLAAVLGPRLAPYVSGGAPWSASWQGPAPGGHAEFRLEIGLQSLKSRLPAPLHYPDGLPAERLVLRTENAGNDAHVLVLNAGPQVNGRLLFQHQAGAWRFAGGRVGFGEERTPPPRGRGLHLSAQINALDLDKWFPLFGQEGGREAPFWLARVSADIRALELLDRQFGHIVLDLAHEKGAWGGTVSGATATGRVRYAHRGRDTAIDLDLATLVLPPAAPAAGAEADTDPRRLPVLTLRSKSLVLRDKPLGGIDFAAQPSANGWHVTRLNLVRPETRLEMAGDWTFVNDAHRSEFDVQLTSSDMGKTLEALGMPDQMRGGEASVKAHVAWPAAPAKLRAALLNGRAEITSEKGRFLQLKQGAGRFFGILDLSAIGRYLTLDFSPIFGQGFVYDRIHGHMTLERGNVYTDDLSLRGPSAKINVRGRIGLAAEDFDLTMDVQPQLSDSLTLGSLAVFGPHVAATVLALQKIFKKEITETTRVNYVVKGPWDNPTVTRTLEESKAAETKPRG